MYRDTKNKKCNVCGCSILDHQTVCNSCINWYEGIKAMHSFKVYKNLKYISESIDYLYPSLTFLKRAKETTLDKKTFIGLGSISRISYVLEKTQREICNMLH